MNTTHQYRFLNKSGKNTSELLSSLETEPITAASIGQVYRGTLLRGESIF